jgi:hypothetical protein
MAKIAVCLINSPKSKLPKKDPDPEESFSKHKEFFLKQENHPFVLNEEYAKLIREQTGWYDITLISTLYLRFSDLMHFN